MTEAIDEHFVRQVSAWRLAGGAVSSGWTRRLGPTTQIGCWPVFDAQLQSRHLDLAARWLQRQGEGFYTIGSSGHESNAAVALALRPTDPALLHYRSGGFYCASAGQVPGTTPIADVLSGVAAVDQRPHLRWSTQGLRPPRPLGDPADLHDRVAPAACVRARLLARPSVRARTSRRRGPPDAVVVASFGDASVNHSTLVGALNATAYCTSRRAAGTAAAGLRGQRLRDQHADALRLGRARPCRAGRASTTSRPTATGRPRPAQAGGRGGPIGFAAERGRWSCTCDAVRFMGHAGSDVELGYRSRAEIVRDYARDPLLGNGRHPGRASAR